VQDIKKQRLAKASGFIYIQFEKQETTKPIINMPSLAYSQCNHIKTINGRSQKVNKVYKNNRFEIKGIDILLIEIIQPSLVTRRSHSAMKE
jgi:hypothetical protein